VLIRLGLNGDEFKNTRNHLTKKLAGSAAWKHGRRDRPAAEATTPASDTAASDDADEGHAAA
jgi:hypothetical protein